MQFTDDVLIIVQARLGSTRLPGKVLLQLGDKSVVQRVYDTCSTVAKTIVAIPAGDKDLQNHLIYKKIPFFMHSKDENDVLSRYYWCADFEKPKHVVRITADCPLITRDVIALVIKKHLESSADITSNVAYKRTFPKGYDVEVFTREALRMAYSSAYQIYDREHVTTWMKYNLKICPVFQEVDQSIFNCCLDTFEDYERLKKMLN